MELRSLACVREVVFHYDVPLTSERGHRPFADPKVVTVLGAYIFQARDAVNQSYGQIIKIDSQLDSKIRTGSGPIDYQVEGYEFTVALSRIDTEKTPYANLEKAVLEFLRRVPFKPVVGTASESLFEKIKSHQPSKIHV
jgi:hypothetical protein